MTEVFIHSSEETTTKHAPKTAAAVGLQYFIIV